MTEFKKIPKDIATRMIFNQILQGNRPDVNVFKNLIITSGGQGAFDWGLSPEGSRFWNTILVGGFYHEFAMKYPKIESNEHK